MKEWQRGRKKSKRFEGLSSVEGCWKDEDFS